MGLCGLVIGARVVGGGVQGCSLQYSVIVSSPTHDLFSLCDSSGTLHSLSRERKPPPQDLEQLDQEVQEPHNGVGGVVIGACDDITNSSVVISVVFASVVFLIVFFFVVWDHGFGGTGCSVVDFVVTLTDSVVVCGQGVGGSG